MKPRNHVLLDRDNTIIVLIDLQEPFLRKIHQRDELLDRTSFLLKAAGVFDIPVLATTQNASRMGPIIPQIAQLLTEEKQPVVDKMTFSAAAADSFSEHLLGFGRNQVLVFGVETHICVQQTALDLVHLDFQVHCAADAVSSRTLEQHKLGMEKMRDCGVIPTSAESAVMELLYTAGSPQFKPILSMIR